MRYSLLSRFQGVLVGAAFGSDLGAQAASQRSRLKSTIATPARAPINLYYWQAGQDSALEPGLAEQLTHWGKTVLIWTEELSQSDYLATPEPTAAENATAGTTEALSEAVLKAATLTTGAALAISTLPITLFFHDQEIKLGQQLQHKLQQMGVEPTAQAAVLEGLLAVSHAIALALKEQLDPPTLIPQTLAYLQQQSRFPGPSQAASSQLMGLLEQTQQRWQQGSDLYTVGTELLKLNESAVHPSTPSSVLQTSMNPGAIALAFYCFVSAADDSHLAMVRAARSPQMPHLVCALTGALAGAYNSRAGIPLAWNLLPTSHSLSWGVPAATLDRLASQLFAAWSGAYDPSCFGCTAAIAAPNVLRRR